jgi:hypothetical protein
MLEYLEQESSIELASKAFHWVVHSGRPLTLEEVVEALALDENEKKLDLNITFSDPRDLLRVSSSLLYEADLAEGHLRKASYKCIRLCHYTVEVCIIRTTLGRLFSER